MLNRGLLPAMEEALLRLKSWCGHRVLVEESLSRAPEAGHNRHFATLSRFVMQLDDVGWQFSGCSLALYGHQLGLLADYQVALDQVVELTWETSSALVLVERFGAAAERRSTFTLQGDA